MQHKVPTTALNAVDNAPKHRDVRRATEMLDEIKPQAPHAAAIERIEILVGETVIDNRNAPISLAI